MSERLLGLVARVLRVPDPPQPPGGVGEDVRAIRPAPRHLHLKILGWGWKQLGVLIGLVLGLTVFVGHAPPVELPSWMVRLELLGAVAWALQLPFSLAVVVLDHRRRWYLIGERALRVREGVLTVREQTMSFGNVQNLSVRQGPVQRMFGIADLEVRSAGGGGARRSEDGRDRRDPHLAYCSGVADADGLRDLVLERVREWRREAGAEERTGEPSRPESGPAERPAVEAARRVLSELRLATTVVVGEAASTVDPPPEERPRA